MGFASLGSAYLVSMAMRFLGWLVSKEILEIMYFSLDYAAQLLLKLDLSALSSIASTLHLF